MSPGASSREDARGAGPSVSRADESHRPLLPARGQRFVSCSGPALWLLQVKQFYLVPRACVSAGSPLHCGSSAQPGRREGGPGRAAGPVAGREQGSLRRVSTAGVGSCEGPATLSLDACPWLGVCPKQRVAGWSPSRGAGALLFTGGPLSRGARASVLTCPSLCCPRCGPGHRPLSPSVASLSSLPDERLGPRPSWLLLSPGGPRTGSLSSVLGLP